MYQWKRCAIGITVGLGLFTSRSSIAIPPDTAPATQPVVKSVLIDSPGDIGGRRVDAKLPPLTKADWASARSLSLARTPAQWNLEPDTAAAAPQDAFLAAPLRRRPLGASDGEAFSVHSVSLSAPAADLAAVAYQSGTKAPFHDQIDKTTIDVMRLAQVTAAATIDIPADADVLDLSPDGAMLLAVTGNDRVDAYAVRDKSITPVAGWRPYENDPEGTNAPAKTAPAKATAGRPGATSGRPGATSANALPPGSRRGIGASVDRPRGERPPQTRFSQRRPEQAEDVVFGAFVDSAHVLTCSKRGRLVQWELPQCRAVWAVSILQGANAQFQLAQPRLSPGRKQLAVADPEGVTVLDASAGEVLASLRDRTPPGPQGIAYQPDGTHLAHYRWQYFGVLTVWDLKTGQVSSECVVNQPTWADGSVQWCGASDVMVARELLVNLASRVPVWKYTKTHGGDTARAAPPVQRDDRYWTVVEDQAGATRLVAAPLPHEEARLLIDGLKPDDFKGIKAGSAITVNVKSDQNPDAVRKRMTDKLHDAGFETADDAPARLDVSIAPNGFRRVAYRTIAPTGPFGPSDAVASVPVYDVTMSFSLDGATLWEMNAGRSNAPALLNLRRGQSIQDYIDFLNANPGSSVFDAMEFPHAIPKQLDKLNESPLPVK